jgi:CHAT domain-containing protein
LGNKDAVVRALNNIGEIHKLQGSYAQALEYHQKSLAMKKALGHKAGVAGSLNNLGNVYRQQGNYAQALEYYQESLPMQKALGNKVEIANLLSDIGETYRLQGNYLQALEYLQKSLAMRETLGTKAEIADTLINIGEIHKEQARYSQALDFTERATALARQVGYIEALWQARLTAGAAYRALNQPAQARRAFEEAISSIETLRAQVAGGEQEQQRFLENKVAPYQAIVELLISQNQNAEALAYAERAKARVLLDVLHSGRVNVTKAMTAQQQEQERRLNSELISMNAQISRENLRPQPDGARLNGLRAQLQKARLDYEAFQTSLYAAHPKLKTVRGEMRPLTLEQASDLLADVHSALLEFAVTDEKTFLFGLTRAKANTPAAVELKVYPIEIKRKDLAERAARFRQLLAKRDPGFRQSARELYDLLLKPAQAQLQGKSSLVIVPDDALWELPFQALQPTPTRYLLEDCTVSYAPSLTVLKEMIRLRKKPTPALGSSTLLAFGNPALGKQTIQRVKSVLMDEKLDPLPEAERQVKLLLQIYGAAQSKVYIGPEAREERAQLGTVCGGLSDDRGQPVEGRILQHDGVDGGVSSSTARKARRRQRQEQQQIGSVTCGGVEVAG